MREGTSLPKEILDHGGFGEPWARKTKRAVTGDYLLKLIHQFMGGSFRKWGPDEFKLGGKPLRGRTG